MDSRTLIGLLADAIHDLHDRLRTAHATIAHQDGRLRCGCPLCLNPTADAATLAGWLAATREEAARETPR